MKNSIARYEDKPEIVDVGTRLTALAHGGGCGCKLSPATLREVLAGMPFGAAAADLLVGTETGDDAAVYRLNDQQALIATTDFFTPIVDDPLDFGRIAATNALSDVYAMGGKPILALAILGIPLGKVRSETIRAILAGGADVCEKAGVPIAGGHSIDTPEPIYGLVALGLVHPDRLRRNCSARPGDRLILTKPLGVGIITTAVKVDAAPAGAYAAMLQTTTRLNAVGAALAENDAVHAITDVTGFGLLGHTLEMCRGAGLGAQLTFEAVPLLPGVDALARSGYRTGAARRNWASYGAEVTIPPMWDAWRRDVLCDPQTSGGLLIATAPDDTDLILSEVRKAGFAEASVIGVTQVGAGLDIR